MNEKAFDINIQNEKDLYPDGYQIDDELDKDIQLFFKQQKNDDKEFKNKSIENEEEESSSSSDMIYSTFPSNVELIKKNIYQKLNISENLIKTVIEEYSKTKNKFLEKNENNKKEKNKFFIKNKNLNEFDYPSDDIIINNILPFKSQSYIMKNINKSFKLLKMNGKENANKNFEKLCEWLYTFLLFIEMPLSQDYSADLYSINKYIYNNFSKKPEVKIIFIIISEIFKQVIVI